MCGSGRIPVMDDNESVQMGLEVFLTEPGYNVTAIVSSGHANNPIVSEHVKYGFKGVLMKPCTSAELAQCLKKPLSVKPLA